MKSSKIALFVLFVLALAPLASLAQVVGNDVRLERSDATTEIWYWYITTPYSVLRFIFHCDDATELKVSMANTGTEGMKWRATVNILGKTSQKKSITASGKHDVFTNPVVLKTGGIAPLWVVVEIRYFGGPVSYVAGNGGIKFETNGVSGFTHSSGYPIFTDY